METSKENSPKQKPFNWNKFWRKFKVIAILSIAVFAFAILGMFQDSGFLTSGGVVAQVDGESITAKEFRRSYEKFQSRFGGAMGAGPQQKYFQGMILNQLIELEVISQSAKKMGLVSSDEEIAGQIVDILKSIPNISQFGVTVQQQYQALLSSNKLIPVEFEKTLRKQVAMDRIRNLFERSVYMTSAEYSMNEQLKTIKIELDFVKFSKSSLTSNIKNSPSEIEHYSSTQSKKIENYYKDNKSLYSIPPQVRARHILVTFKPGDENSVKVANEKINRINKRLKGESFEVLAKEESDDLDSKEKGGDLGFFTKGSQLLEIDKVAFSLGVGQVSAPFKTNSGYHIVKLVAKKPIKTKALSLVRNQIVENLLMKEKISGSVKKIEESLVSSTQLKSTLKKYNLQWQDTGVFNLDSLVVPKLGSSSKFMKMALSLEVKGQSSKELFLLDGWYYILRLKSKITTGSSVSLATKK